jgi:hypothetical protein
VAGCVAGACLSSPRQAPARRISIASKGFQVKLARPFLCLMTSYRSSLRNITPIEGIKRLALGAVFQLICIDLFLDLTGAWHRVQCYQVTLAKLIGH